MTKHESILSLIASQGLIGDNMKSFLINHYMSMSPGDFVTAYNKTSKESYLQYLGGNIYEVKFY